MGIREKTIEENMETAIISLHFKKFEDIGYFIRDFKNRLKGKKIFNIRMTLKVDYYKEGEE